MKKYRKTRKNKKNGGASIRNLKSVRKQLFTTRGRSRQRQDGSRHTDDSMRRKDDKDNYKRFVKEDFESDENLKSNQNFESEEYKKGYDEGFRQCLENNQTI